MATVTSKDGTTIAFDAYGQGQPLVMIDGATAYHGINPTNGQVGELLAKDFNVIAYDRRGRGDSTDTKPYAIEREIEDVAALIEAAGGGPAVLFGWSSGGVLAMDATAAGLPVTHLVPFEPPFVVDDSRPPMPADYVERLDAAVAAGRPGDAAELFATTMTGASPEDVAGMRQSDFWPVMEAVAPTIAYDGRIMRGTMDGKAPPTDRWAAISVPVLIMYSKATLPSLITASEAAAELLPTATLQGVEGEFHSTSADILAPALRKFVQG